MEAILSLFGKIKLVDNASRLHKSSTVVLSAVLILLSLLEFVLPALDLIRPVFGENVYNIAVLVITVLISVGRFVKQTSLQVPPVVEPPK